MKKIYGVSSKHNFGKWQHVCYEFENREDAEKWLHTEEYDFRERELFTSKKAVQKFTEQRNINFIKYGKEDFKNEKRL